ncbi:MAG TPA: DUF6345 domain-containing protein [Fibrobacteria bacterium]|nr:DUF6345 domain-containing protein [Fibrobacteria bacterium]
MSIAVLAIGNPHAYPISMDIGTFSIDDYSGNGGGIGNLGFMVGAAQNFFWAANAILPGYSLLAAPGTGSASPTFALDARNTQVTMSAITNTSSGYGNREYCDFLFYGGHGLNSSFYLGAGAGYGQVLPANIPLGTGYNRWLLTNSCSMFNGGTPAIVWQPAFKGIKAMLGFKSFAFDNNLSWELFNEFWVNWTYREQSLLNSFFDAQANYGYKHLYPGKGLEPGCLSAEVPPMRIDYCREAFKYVNHDYTAATANTGYYYSKVIGSPQY